MGQKVSLKIENVGFFLINHTIHHAFVFKKNQRFLVNFSALNPNLVLDFFPARQVPELILKEPSKNTENASIEWLQIEITKYFPNTKVYVFFLTLNLVFKTVFGIFLTPLISFKSVK
jgi:hypothetical protein